MWWSTRCFRPHPGADQQPRANRAAGIRHGQGHQPAHAHLSAPEPRDLEAVAQRFTPRWWCGETSSAARVRRASVAHAAHGRGHRRGASGGPGATDRSKPGPAVHYRGDCVAVGSTILIRRRHSGASSPRRSPLISYRWGRPGTHAPDRPLGSTEWAHAPATDQTRWRSPAIPTRKSRASRLPEFPRALLRCGIHSFESGKKRLAIEPGAVQIYA